MKHRRSRYLVLAALCLLLVTAALGEGLTPEEEPEEALDIAFELSEPEEREIDLETEDMLRAEAEATDETRRAVAADDGVAIDAVNFPDGTFREKVVAKCDQDGDGTLSAKEIEGVLTLYAGGYGIADLKGIEFFWNLEDLDVSNNALTSLDVSQNTKLSSLSAGSNPITALNVSANKELEELHCADMSALTSINANGLTKLNYVYYDMYEGKGSLSELDLTGCAALTSLTCRGGMLKSLDLSDCVALRYVSCTNNSITTLDVSNQPELTELECDGCPLTGLDVSEHVYLERLSLENCALTTLDVSGCSAMRYLNCANNSLSQLDLSDCTALVELDCSHNSIGELELTAMPQLSKLYCQLNRLSSLDVSGCAALTALYCGGNQLTQLDITNCTDIGVLNCRQNLLTRLDASNVRFVLNCAENRLAELIVSKKPQFDSLYCFSNQLTQLDLSGAYVLLVLHCHDNPMTTLDVSGCPGIAVNIDPEIHMRRELSDDGKVVTIMNPAKGYDSSGHEIELWREDCIRFDAAIKITENGKTLYDGDMLNPTQTDGPWSVVNPTRIQLSREGKLLQMGETTVVSWLYPAQLEAVLTPADTQTTLTWTSEDPDIATVTDGLVTVVSQGRTRITVTAANGVMTMVYVVTIAEPDPTSEPTPAPTQSPSPEPTPAPTAAPTVAPTATIGEAAYMFTDKTGTYEVIGAQVTFVKPAKSAASVKVPDTVNANGEKVKVTAIADKAFYKDRKLTAVTIGKYVKTIGKNAFYGCKKLKTITIRTSKLTDKTVGKNAFKGVFGKATFKCPKKKLKAYKKLLKKKGAPKKAKYKGA